MANVSFNLKNKSDKLAHILLRYRFTKTDVLKYYTGEKVPPKFWSNTSYVSRSYPGASKINEYLNHLKRVAEDIRRQMLIDGVQLTRSEFKKKIDSNLGIIDNRLSWSDYATSVYNAKLKEVDGDHNRIRGLKSNIGVLLKYLGNKTLDQISKEDITKMQNDMLDDDYAPKYINKVIGRLNSLLNKAVEDGHSVNQSYKRVNRLGNVKSKDQIFCTYDEIKKIYNHEYESESLRNAANIFIIGALTSLRVSEYMQVASDPKGHIYNIKGTKMIKILSTDKTRKKVAIPLHYIIEDMLSKYEIRPISSQKLNDFLKRIGQAVGMDESFTRVEYKGRKEITKTYKRYELLSSHTARRSFITILYMMGVDMKVIRMFSTHSTEKQLLEYMKMNEEMNAIRMADHPFFKKPGLRIV